MRKFIIYVLTLVLTLCCYTTIYADETQVDTIKIGLFYASTAKTGVTISSADGFYAGTEVDGEFIQDNLIAETEVSVSAGEGNTVDMGGFVYTAEQFPTLYPVSGNIFVDGTEYRGGVQFKRVNGGLLTVINVVNIEEYLYSVIGKEMSPGWNIEALKAQAVCARGFAISNKNKFASYGFNLDTTTTSQVYPGVSSETESTRRAVDETRGQVLKHNGTIIESIYCASMGGASADAANVWGGSYPYLVSVVDPYEDPSEATRYSWSVTLTADEIKTCLANEGVNIGDIKNVEIVKQDDAGYVLELRFTGTNGTHTVTRSKCRNIFGGKLYSQRFSIAGTSGSAAVSAGPLRKFDISGANSNLIYSIAYVFDIDMGIPAQNRFTTPVAAVTAPTEYTFNGNGWGHGVGMSQWGAKAMADKGFSYGDILTFYYTGTYLESAY